MVAVVRAVAEDELVILAGELEGGGHVLIGEGPVAVLVVEVVPAVLQEDADLAAEGEQGSSAPAWCKRPSARFHLGLADERRDRRSRRGCW